MSSARSASKRSDEEAQSLFREILDRIKTEEDPLTLNEYRSLVRKHVPFFMRSYFSAYLFMRLLQATPSRPRKEKDRNRTERAERDPAQRTERKARPEPKAERAPKVEREPRAEREPRREEAPRRSLPDAEAATLFFGVGRNRRAYARDLLAFITEDSGIAADDVGELRVLDNFSFVQVRSEFAEKAIAELNGKEFRGRAISVSRAKPRKEESAAAAETIPPVSDGDADTFPDDEE